MKKTLLKAVFSISGIALAHTILSAYAPTVSSSIAVDQLNDSYSSNSNMTIYQNIKNYIWILYIVTIGFIFRKEIKSQTK